jgi:RNA polymerase sigma-70 factor (ECF subfamily)
VTVEPDDRSVIERVARQEPSGLEVLYDRYSAPVYSLAMRIVRDTAEAEDVTQEVFAQVWATASRFDVTRGSVGAWLMVIARSRALDRLRRRAAALKPGPGESALSNIPDPAPSVELAAATAEQVVAARDALAMLPAEERAALELAYYEGLTQAEIAARTATPLGTVKTRIRNGLRRIRDAMARSTPARSEA